MRVVETEPTIKAIRSKFELLAPVLNERLRRLWAAAEAKGLGRGGITAVCAATKFSRTTVRKGVRELDEGIQPGGEEFIRRPGAGRPTLEEVDPELMVALEHLVEPVTRGDPESPLRWTAKSVRNLSSELRNLGHRASPQKVCEMLRALGYSLLGNSKTREGTQHPDRNAQFEQISASVKLFQRRGQPAISVDTKKKELIGDFLNRGKEWRPQGEPEEVRVHDFIDEDLGKVSPYGVYDLTANEGWVNVGTDHDTPEFAVESIRRWWHRMGRKAYPQARELFITADAGGSNGYRSRVWKVRLQKLASELGLKISVSHFPPGTSKWNKIEHRMFSHITMNWRGKPLVSHEVIVNLIGSTTTRKGLRIEADLDRGTYQTGVKISDAEFDGLNLIPSKFHGDWNYTLAPSRQA